MLLQHATKALNTQLFDATRIFVRVQGNQSDRGMTPCPRNREHSKQGRQINVSVQVLNAVARTLSLDAAEKAHLYRLADVPTVPTAHAGTALPEELQVILDHLEPLPGVVLSPRYDVLAHNQSYEALCPGFVRGERNVARRVFLTPECCNTYH
ncbi:MmyB family transcriptional regulator, partial [Nocardia sp. NPDC004278]